MIESTEENLSSLLYLNTGRILQVNGKIVLSSSSFWNYLWLHECFEIELRCTKTGECDGNVFNVMIGVLVQL